MDVELSGTKRALVLAAGELFAEAGGGQRECAYDC